MKLLRKESDRRRREKDSLGTIEVPADALWGAHTARALQNFPVSGKAADPSLIRAYLRIKKCAAICNAECGALAPEQALLIEKAADELLRLPEEEWPAHFPVDVFQAGAGTSQNMNVNEVLANVANRLAGMPPGSYRPVHPNDHVNASQSTNDTYPTALRLALLEASAPLSRALEELAGAFEAKGRDWVDLPKSARTHLQDAVPMRLGPEIGAYGSAIRRAARWLELARDELRELGIGGSAAGTSLNVPPGYIPAVIRELSQLTREPLRAASDLYETMQSQAPVAFYSSMLRLAAIELTRICNDLRLLASGPMTGFGELRLPATQAGSSIMPGKVNPSIPEMANQAWFAVIGRDQTVALAVQAGQLELNVMMPVMAYAALDATRIATQAARILRLRCVEGMQAEPTRLRRHFESTPQVATALSPRLGYAATAELVTDSLAAGKSVLELARERKLLSEEEIAELIDLKRLTGG